MLVKILGLADILAGVMVALLTFGIKSSLVLLLACYLIVKGVIFFSKASVVDMMIALIIFYAYLNQVHWIVTTIIAIWLLQKGILSVVLT